MKTYKLSNGPDEWLMIYENLTSEIAHDTGRTEDEIRLEPDEKFPIQEQELSKRKSLYTMSDDVAEWLRKEIDWKIYFNAEVRETSNAYERTEARQELSRWRTLKKQLESQL